MPAMPQKESRIIRIIPAPRRRPKLVESKIIRIKPVPHLQPGKSQGKQQIPNGVEESGLDNDTPQKFEK